MAYKNKQDLYDNQKARWIRRKKEAVIYKGGKCQICGYNRSIAALQFHHRDPTTKLFNWTKLRLRTREDIYTELDKCDLLCDNCHSEITYPAEHNWL